MLAWTLKPSGKGQSSCVHVYSLANTVVADVLGPLCILQMKKRHINDKTNNRLCAVRVERGKVGGRHKTRERSGFDPTDRPTGRAQRGEKFESEQSDRPTLRRAQRGEFLSRKRPTDRPTRTLS